MAETAPINVPVELDIGEALAGIRRTLATWNVAVEITQVRRTLEEIEDEIDEAIEADCDALNAGIDAVRGHYVVTAAELVLLIEAIDRRKAGGGR